MPTSRRRFRSSMGAVTLGAVSGVATVADTQAELLRVITYNAYGCTGWPENRRPAQAAASRGQMAERLAMELALHEPDMVTLSESPGEDVASEIAQGLEMNWAWFPSDRLDPAAPRGQRLHGRLGEGHPNLRPRIVASAGGDTGAPGV